jgi:ubiquinone/menaquinone biosynthesis C-methylase UbiE
MGTRVLEVPCGTGTLQLDLVQAGYAPVGVDLSPHMLRISMDKARAKGRVPGLIRARVQNLPFPVSAFDTAIMTFPPGFIYDPQAIAELRRVLVPGGRLLWVDAGRLKPRDWWSRALNGALNFVSGGEGEFANYATRLLDADGFDAVAEWVEDAASLVVVVTATRRGEN